MASVCWLIGLFIFVYFFFTYYLVHMHTHGLVIFFFFNFIRVSLSQTEDIRQGASSRMLLASSRIGPMDWHLEADGQMPGKEGWS